MKQSYFPVANIVSSGSNVVRKFIVTGAFIMAFAALKGGEQLSVAIIIYLILAAFFGLLLNSITLFQKQDCFECMSPHEIAVYPAP